MTDDEAAFLRTICEYPDDDRVRLIFADWLEENGRPERAEFIRIQIAVRDGSASDFERDREGVLFRALREEWADEDILVTPNPDWFADPDGKRLDRASVLIAAGFPAEVRAPSAWMLGGECGHCTVRGQPIDRNFWLGESEPCPACHGTGRTPGHLAGLVEKWPIERVVVSGPDPLWERSDGGWVAGPGRWMSAKAGTDPEDVPLPDGLWEVFSDPDNGWPYPTRTAALAALSDAVLTVARGRATLPSA